MLDQLAAQHGRKIPVVVREAVFLGIEQIDVAAKVFAVFRSDAAMIGLAARAVVAAADFAIAEPGFERGRDLEIGAHFQILGRPDRPVA